MRTKPRYRVIRTEDRRYPVQMVDTLTNRVRGRYYATSLWSAKHHAAGLNEQWRKECER